MLSSWLVKRLDRDRSKEADGLLWRPLTPSTLWRSPLSYQPGLVIYLTQGQGGRGQEGSCVDGQHQQVSSVHLQAALNELASLETRHARVHGPCGMPGAPGSRSGCLRCRAFGPVLTLAPHRKGMHTASQVRVALWHPC